MTKKIKIVYVAGLITPRGVNSVHPAIDYLLNVRNLIRASLDVFMAGFTPFCPALDFLFFLQLEKGEYITEAMIKRFSKDFLSVSDALVLTPKWRKSPGTLAEIELAKKLEIPVFDTLDDLEDYVEKEEKNDGRD